MCNNHRKSCYSLPMPCASPPAVMSQCFQYYDAHPGNPGYIPQRLNETEPAPLPSPPACALPEETCHIPACQPETLPEFAPQGESFREFLSAHVGRLVRVEFLLADTIIERVGILSEVGADYIVLEALDGGSRLLGDLCSIRFVTVVGEQEADMTSPWAVMTGKLCCSD